MNAIRRHQFLPGGKILGHTKNSDEVAVLIAGDHIISAACFSQDDFGFFNFALVTWWAEVSLPVYRDHFFLNSAAVMARRIQFLVCGSALGENSELNGFWQLKYPQSFPRQLSRLAPALETLVRFFGQKQARDDEGFDS